MITFDQCTRHAPVRWTVNGLCGKIVGFGRRHVQASGKPDGSRPERFDFAKVEFPDGGVLQIDLEKLERVDD